MNALRKRLAKLEKAIGVEGPCWADYFHLVNQTAFAKMSGAELDLLHGRTTLTNDLVRSTEYL